MRILVLNSLLIFLLSGQTVSKSHSRSLQKQLDLILGSHLFHKAFSEDALSLGFSGHTSTVFLKNAEKWNNKEIESITIRSLQAFVNLPFNIQAHFQLALPNDKFEGISTKIFGYGLKYKLPWFKIRYFPDLHVQYAHNQIELNGHVTSTSDIFTAYADKKILFFNAYAAAAYQINKTVINKQSFFYDNQQKELLYKIGLKINYSVFTISTETTFHNYNNVTAGLTINF